MISNLYFYFSYFTNSASDIRLSISRIDIASSSSPRTQTYELLSNGILCRAINPYGSAAYTFITMGTYIGGRNTFTIITLASKPFHLCSNWGYGRIYTVVVVNCTFLQPINLDNSGSALLLHASTSGGGDTKFNHTNTIPTLTEPHDTILALTEPSGNLDMLRFKM